MLNPSGQLVLNGITDPELVKILDIKIKNEVVLNFNPAQMQSGVSNLGGKQTHLYNNVVLGWTSEQGLQAIQDLVQILLKKEEAAKVVGQ
jgi:hypothetical protein